MTLRAREQEILGTTARGLRNNEIARHPDISDCNLPYRQWAM